MKTKCEKHPKYKGKNKPKHECVCCLNIYIKLHQRPRMLPKPTTVIKSKKIYDRKKNKT